MLSLMFAAHVGMIANAAARRVRKTKQADCSILHQIGREKK
jgi:hypothetical protein